MFCPLCQSEYREGYAECSDCHIDLVERFEDAQFAAVRLWEGEQQRVFDAILTALADESIPSHWKETARPAYRRLALRPLFGWGAIKESFHYEVWVLRSDADRARGATAHVVK